MKAITTQKNQELATKDKQIENLIHNKDKDMTIADLKSQLDASERSCQTKVTEEVNRVRNELEQENLAKLNALKSQYQTEMMKAAKDQSDQKASYE